MLNSYAYLACCLAAITRLSYSTCMWEIRDPDGNSDNRAIVHCRHGQINCAERIDHAGRRLTYIPVTNDDCDPRVAPACPKLCHVPSAAVLNDNAFVEEIVDTQASVEDEAHSLRSSEREAATALQMLKDAVTRAEEAANKVRTSSTVRATPATRAPATHAPAEHAGQHANAPSRDVGDEAPAPQDHALLQSDVSASKP